MTTPTGMLLFEVGIPLLGVLAAPLAVITWLIHPLGDWIGSAALAALGALSLPYLLQVPSWLSPRETSYHGQQERHRPGGLTQRRASDPGPSNPGSTPRACHCRYLTTTESAFSLVIQVALV